ncbi:HAD-IA family hydrolase [Mobilitalea sibirica]|uniref:HAD-IA family hydrolase n=1 Tax=Mobilitalea sibirica TaxID=1462919 RepID=A0A8J7H1P8_9FIRM|nr:HAD-IA family hydrolase [Mobilitalea sibirica]MBH1940393.1 HAD-IA family hydrolase [Mobilitalea sibirica]
MYQNIIWDFDGTLFDTYPSMTKTFLRVLKDNGINESYENILRLMKISASHAFRYCTENYQISEDRLYHFYTIDKKTNPEDFLPFPDCKDICKRIYESGKKNYLFTHRGKDAIAHIKHYGLDQYFEEYVIGGSGFKRKPDPEGILYLMDKYNMKPEDTLMIGDRDIDIIAAKNASIKACYFWQHPNAVVKEADHIIASIQELEAIIGL